MYLAVVGCSIFKNEIDFLKSEISSNLEFYWLPQRLHNTPLELRRLIQGEIDSIDESNKPYDAIVLLYGLCSKGTIGTSSKKYMLVIPKVQDCIAILLGSNERYRVHFNEKPGTYWFTRGWIETGFRPGKRSKHEGVFDPYKERYKEYRKKFSDEISRYLINEWDQKWIKNYTTLAFISWGMKGELRLRKLAEENADNLGLQFENLRGNTGLLLNLLNGNWGEGTYLKVEPGFKILPSYDSEVLVCNGKSDQGIQWEKEYKDDKRDIEVRKGIGLGIDAGGTYTDSVLLDFTSNRVIESYKALTTHDNYAAGIKNSIKGLIEKVPGFPISSIGLVSLSTTLATNAIVEGKGGRVGLILIGYDKHSVKKIDFGPKVVIEGRHDINGEEIEPLDIGEAKEAIRYLILKGVESFAVSSEVGVRNPFFEQSVKGLILKTTDLPVVCGSELTDELNCVKRANTCYFNAKLIPLVSDLLLSVKKVLQDLKIKAPIMVVKGDGTLMGEEVAKTNPIEMVLSGPSASSIGGAYLSKVRDGYIVDMGGTTTDMAFLKNGFVAFKKEGIQINSFRTTVKTVNVHTFGLGGDSYIKYDLKKGRIEIGPERVIPISYLADEYPKVLSILEKRRGLMGGDEILVQPCDFFIFQKDVSGVQLHSQERDILSVLKKEGPMSRTELSQRVHAKSLSLLRTERLEKTHNILRSALTPTDILHVEGKISLWDGKAAQKALSLYSQRARCDDRIFIIEFFKQFYQKMLFHLFQFLFKEDRSVKGEVAFSQNLSSQIFSQEKEVWLSPEIKKPIVFIGAPAKAFASGIYEYIKAEVIIPEYYGVANAVGAITGTVRENVTILIRPGFDGGFVAYTSKEKMYFPTLSQAKQEMAELAKEIALERALKSWASCLNVDVKVEDKEVKVSDEDRLYLETVVSASAQGIPVMDEPLTQ